LGGGVAKIVGALQGLKAVAFASPGLVYTSKKLGFSQDVLDRIAINVKPELDLISDIDILGGDVQRLKCLFVSSYYCHRLFGIIDQLINVCGKRKAPLFHEPFSNSLQVTRKADGWLHHNLSYRLQVSQWAERVQLG